MEQVALITSLASFMLIAALCSIAFNKLKLPPLIGYLIAGIIIANIVTASADSVMVVEILSDMGLIMLMFCIGMEINLKKIRRQGLFAIEVAVIQLPLMVLGGYIGGTLLGFSMLQSLCLGAIISGSSTAAVMAVLKTHKALTKEQVDTIVLITIMEDIGQVLILSMITPMLAGGSMETGALITLIASILIFMVVSIIIGLKIVPRIVNWVADNVENEILVVFSVGLAFCMALLAYKAGLSVAIGAFLMGMMVASSRKSKEITRDIEPMKSIFMAMFFISVGMEISVSTLWANIGLAVIIFLLFAVLKSSTVFLGYWIGNQPSRVAFMSSLSLIAMGEFAFIIAKEALANNVIDEAFYTSVVGAALISMIVLPLMSKASAPIWDKAYDKCPQRIMKSLIGITHARNNVYAKASSTSKKTRKDLATDLKHTYVCIILVAIVEIVFSLTTITLAKSGYAMFGGSTLFWGCMVMLVNVILIYLPIVTIVKNIKQFSLTVMDENKREKLESGKHLDDITSKFIRMHDGFMALFVASIIVIIVPNGYSGWEQIGVFIIAALLIFVNHEYNIRKKDNPWTDENTDCEYRVDDDEFTRVMMEKYRSTRHMSTKTAVEQEPAEHVMIMPIADNDAPKDLI